MSEQPSDATEVVVPVAPDDESRARSRSRSRRTRRTDWRLGGSTVRGWREMMIAWACFSLGVGVLGGFMLTTFVAASWAPLAATALLWVSMLVPIVMAFSRSRPIGLLRFRALDLLYGLVLGVMLRFFQGWVAEVSGEGADFPSYVTLDGQLPNGWWFTDALSPVIIAPVLEEFFFRAVILIALYSALRRPFGKVTAGLAALLVSTALFVIVHTVAGEMSTDAAVSLAAVGTVCALLVLLTGRIWGAVLVHMVFNATYVGLALVGTFVG